MFYLIPEDLDGEEADELPKGSEISIGEWLDQIGATKQYVGCDGEGPPDWEIQYKGDTIGVEVTLLHDTEGWGGTKRGRRRKEAFERELRRLIEEVSQEGGQKWHALCEYDPRVPRPPSDDAWKARVRDALGNSPSGGKIQLLSEGDIQRRGLGGGIVLELMPACDGGSFTGVSVDEGYLVGITLSERLIANVDEKADKVRKGKRSGKYNQWWLAFDDEVLIAPFAILTDEERTEIDTRVRECDGRQQLSKIVMVSRFQFTPPSVKQDKWFYVPWEDPRHPPLPPSPYSDSTA